MNQTSIERLVEEFKERAKYHTFNSAVPSKAYENVDIEKASDWLRSALSRARQEGREDVLAEAKKILKHHGVNVPYMEARILNREQFLYALTTEGK